MQRNVAMMKRGIAPILTRMPAQMKTSFSVEISLLDASGAIKGTGYSNAVNNWTLGQKATVDVYFTDMNVDPAQYTIKYVPRYQSGTMYG